MLSAREYIERTHTILAEYESGGPSRRTTEQDLLVALTTATLAVAAAIVQAGKLP